MYKTHKNPKIEELTKSHRDRQIRLSDVRVIKLPDGKRMCIWCNENPLRHHNQKYCCNDCSKSAMAWAYPQQEDGLNVLMVRQNWKCNICSYSWLSLAQEILSKLPSLDKRDISEWNWIVIKRLKSRTPKEYRPEVDHIIPIFKGGQSIGLENHQAICYSCHKKKTSKDLSKA